MIPRIPLRLAAGLAILATIAVTPAFAQAPTNPTLREAAGKRVQIGCAIAAKDLDSPKLTALIAEQFNCITPEYDMMPEKLVDDNGKYTFENADAVVVFAEQHHLPVLGHMLVWNYVTRKWLFADAADKPLPREKALANLHDYITAVVTHYRGRIQAWDVVNEALNDSPTEYLKDTPARRAIGDDYIAKAFEFAHAADPNAKLYYNDYNIEQPDKLAKTVRLIRSLKSAGVRIDSVGIQGHWLLAYPSTDTMDKAIDTLAATGVSVMITELDIDPLPRATGTASLDTKESGADPYPIAFPEDKQAELAHRYADIITALLRHPSVTVIGFWGTYDGRSWLNDFPVKGRTNYPLLFDRQLKPKPAFNAVVKALEAGRK